MSRNDVESRNVVVINGGGGVVHYNVKQPKSRLMLLLVYP
jgi:hypothetical protein